MYLTKCHIRNQISLSITCKENIKFRMSNGMKEKKEKSEKGKKMVIALNEWKCASGTAAPLALVESHSYHAHQLIHDYAMLPSISLSYIHVGMVWVHSWPRRCSRTQASGAYRSILIIFWCEVKKQETQTPSLLFVLD